VFYHNLMMILDSGWVLGSPCIVIAKMWPELLTHLNDLINETSGDMNWWKTHSM